MRQGFFQVNKTARHALSTLVFGVSSLMIAPLAHADCEASKAFTDKYTAATDSAKKGDYTTALSHIKEAVSASKQACEKVASLTKQREFAFSSRNWTEVVAAGEAMNASDAISASQKTYNLKMISDAQQQLRHLDKALPPLKEYIKQTGGKPEDWSNLADLSHSLGDCPGSLAAIEKATGGKTLTEQQLLIQSDCYFKSKDAAKRLPVIEQLTLRFPKQKYFVDLVALYQLSSPAIDDRALLNIYRLGYQKDFLTDAENILRYAKLADAAGASGEALRVVDQSVAKKRLSLDDKSKNFEAQEKRAAAEDSGAVAQLDKESQAGKNGDKDIKVAMMYFGAEQYPNAIAAFTRGLSADHVARVQRPDDANMALGISLVRTKKLADAEKAFNAAKADPRMAKAATLWLALMK